MVGGREGELLIPSVLERALILELVRVHPLKIHIHVHLPWKIIHYLGKVLENISKIRGLKS
jgi:hypothetical protein